MGAGEVVPVTQVDREAAYAFGFRSGRIGERSRDDIAAGVWDATEDVQAFARHRLAQLTTDQAALEAARGALAEYDVAALDCPFRALQRHRPDSDKPCPKCKATSSEGCHHEVRAMFDCIAKVRAALSERNGGTSKPIPFRNADANAELIAAAVNALPALLAQSAADQAALEAARGEVEQLKNELSAMVGYLLNAKIDLETGCSKATAIGTIEGGIRRARAALSAQPGAPA
jgi:hypothetical protein